MQKLNIVSSVTNDLVVDQRVHRVNMYLIDQGFNVHVIGRAKNNSIKLLPRIYQVTRLKPIFQKGVFFYAEFNVRLFFKLLFTKADALLSNDLDTLPANVLVGKMKGISVYYDCHEYFTEVPELVNRPFIQSVWKWIERMCLPFVNRSITVSEQISEAFEGRLKEKMQVVRNFPKSYDLKSTLERNQHFDIDKDQFKVLLYQGSVNVHRGLEELLLAMQYLPLCKLYILGEGDVLNDLKDKTFNYLWKDRIVFLGRVPFEELPSFTTKADLGISIEKKIGKSYTYALPNKFFDYIQAGIPSLISDLPEMIKINMKYQVAEVIPDHNPLTISRTILALFEDQSKYETLKNNCLKARQELNWEKESKLLSRIFLNG